MTHHAKRQDALPELICDMERGVNALLGFALAVRDLGLCEDRVDPGGLYAIGDCMVNQARAIQDEWQRCFDLSRASKGAR